MLRSIILLLFFSLSTPLFAEEGGQIININQNYQIAFTDLGNRILKQGDVVKVLINTEEFVYMQVLESSVILSKLGVSQLEGFRTNLKDFQRLAVGNSVVKINYAQEKTDNSEAIVLEPKTIETPALQQMQKLEQDLGVAKEEIKRLQEFNEASKVRLSQLAIENQSKKTEIAAQEQINNKEIIEQLKAHLDNMHKIVNESN